MEALRETFEGDFELAFHLAPPALGGVDPKTGRYPKKVFGGWMLHVFRVLAKFKVLRGTALDPFSYSVHRKLERALIGEYRTMIETVLADLTADNYALAVEIASLPEQIRGYGSVKEQHLAQAQRRRDQLLTDFADIARNGGKPNPVKIMAVNVG
jgi:indolepyruvate ferredoxin oxidoreductase